MKKVLVASLLMLLLLTACGSNQDAGADGEKTTIVAGFVVGTYEEQFSAGIKPILEEMGYKVEVIVFSQNMQVNPAMAEGAIDLSVFQSTAYMEVISSDLGIEMAGLTFSPSAPQSIHSVRHDSLDAVEDGSTVALPNDPVNQERAVRILEDLGWVTVAEDAGTIDFNINSVSPADYEIDFQILDPAQILVSLPDVDYGIINGNYISEAGMRMAEGLPIEDTPREHRRSIFILAKELRSRGYENCRWFGD